MDPIMSVWGTAPLRLRSVALAHHRGRVSPVLFTLYTSDFKYDCESCHVQKFTADTAIVGCIRSGQEGGVQEPGGGLCDMGQVVKPSAAEHLQTQTDGNGLLEAQVTFATGGLLRKLDWTTNTDTLCRKRQGQLCFLRRLGSFNICRKTPAISYSKSCILYLLWPNWCAVESTTGQSIGDRHYIKALGYLLALGTHIVPHTNNILNPHLVCLHLVNK